MPPRRREPAQDRATRRALRTGHRDGQVSSELRQVLAREAARVTGAGGTGADRDPAAVVREVSDLMAGVDNELLVVAEARLRAVAELRQAGLTYASIADRTGLSLSRVAQLAREARRLPGAGGEPGGG